MKPLPTTALKIIDLCFNFSPKYPKNEKQMPPAISIDGWV